MHRGVIKLSIALSLCGSLAFGCTEAIDGPRTRPIGKADSATPLTLDLDSREFKLMLEPGLFADLDDAVSALEADLDEAVDEAVDRKYTGSLDLEVEREIAFLDVAGSCDLRATGYALRRRSSPDKSQLTLKYRSQDPLLAWLFSTTANDAEYKLEEDVTASAPSIFSSSTSIDSDPAISTVGDVEAIFEGFGLPLPNDELSIVSDVVVFEQVYRGARFDIGAVDAEVALNAWYLDEDDDEPWLVEVSFKYELDQGSVPDATAERARLVFAAWSKLSEWRSLTGATKTASVYSLADFCD